MLALGWAALASIPGGRSRFLDLLGMGGLLNPPVGRQRLTLRIYLCWRQMPELRSSRTVRIIASS